MKHGNKWWKFKHYIWQSKQNDIKQHKNIENQVYRTQPKVIISQYLFWHLVQFKWRSAETIWFYCSNVIFVPIFLWFSFRTSKWSKKSPLPANQTLHLHLIASTFRFLESHILGSKVGFRRNEWHCFSKHHLFLFHVLF